MSNYKAIAYATNFAGTLKGDAPIVKVNQSVTNLGTSLLRDCTIAIKILPDYAEFYSKIDFVQEINFMKVTQRTSALKPALFLKGSTEQYHRLA